MQACIHEKLNDEIVQDKCYQNGEKEVSPKTNVAYKQNEILRLHSEISAFQNTLLKYTKSLNTSEANNACDSVCKLFTEKSHCLYCKTNEVSSFGQLIP